ncbi:UdgX family uracil-DNA binding protein [Bordetella sp. 02P26C-1]|uniref:UdgX family uracil-DNA binding protein n=1 Tax=Bordetella sp. 02P26C-1 TaxID=2683195 RepID=UPI0013531533|nr:UdgX family uracil-DNA binding protein [Bordetella sp. 02P26C-1]MVW78751.1 UdgX family uracil-DNA binding protein [Bordetella sp. 02P26C-1]
MHTLVVNGGYAAWRLQALRALRAGWPPSRVTWVEKVSGVRSGSAQMSLDYAAQPVSSDGMRGRAAGHDCDLAHDSDAVCIATVQPATPGTPTQIRISRELATLLQDAALYRSPQRWGLLYRVLWRWEQGDRAVVSAADEDGAALHSMAKAVRRAKHDMQAYVRFHQREAGDGPEYLAWYEPEHDVLAWGAEHFARRMGATSWCIATPQGAALWDGQDITLSEGPVDADAIRASIAAEQIEPLWKIYYQSIFNPARLNESALHQRMPVRFWKNLPEGPLIPGMIADARSGAQRVGQARTVGQRPGRQIAMDAQQAQPQRAMPTTLEACRRCELWRNATHVVPGQGPDSARIMLVGEQPGDQEDLAGRVFVGPAGQVLNETLHRAGFARESLFLTNAVKHFKWIARGKRRLHQTPAQREVDACAHWLHEEIERVRPAVIVTLGATALNAVLGRKVSLQQYRGRPQRVGEAWLVATWHPSYALRVDDAAKREAVIAGMVDAVEQASRLAGERPA